MLTQTLALDIGSDIGSPCLEETDSFKGHDNQRDTKSEPHHHYSDQAGESATSSISGSEENSASHEDDEDRDSFDTADKEDDEDSHLDSADDRESSREQKAYALEERTKTGAKKEKQFWKGLRTKTLRLAPPEALYAKSLE